MKKHIFIGYIIGFISCCVILSLVLYVLSMPKKEEIKFMPIPEGFAVMIYDEEKQMHLDFSCEDATAYIAVLCGEEEIFSLTCEAVMNNG